MHSVVIGIGGHDDVVVPQAFEVILHSEGGYEQVELFVLGHPLAALLIAVDRLSAQREHGLEVRVAGFGDGSARRVSLSDEDGTAFDEILVLVVDFVVVVVAAVSQLGVEYAGFLVALAGLFLYAGDLLPFLLGSFDLVLDILDYLLVHVQVVVQVPCHEVVDIGPDGRAYICAQNSLFVLILFLPHICGTQLGLGLAFEIRLLNLDADSSHKSLAAVRRLIILFEELLEGLGNSFPEGCQMGATVAGVLPVDERADVLPVGVAVAHHYLYILPFKMYGRVEGLLAEVLPHKVEKTVLALEHSAVEVKAQTLLEVRVVLDHSGDILRVEGVLSEHQAVRGELHQCSVLLAAALLAAVHQLPLLETRPGAHLVAVRTYVELRRQCVDCLGADTVQAYRLLESLVVELASGVEYADGLDHGVEGDSAPVVPHADIPIFYDNAYLLTETGREFVYGVVYYLLEQHIDAVAGALSVTEPANVHSGTAADVLDTFQGPNVVVCVCCILTHFAVISLLRP